MGTSQSPSGWTPVKTSYRKEMAKLRESKPLTKELVHECVKNLLPQEPAYVLAVKNWSLLDKFSRSYIASAIGPDEDFEYIDDHLTLATEPTQSNGMDCHFEELVAAGWLQPLSRSKIMNVSASSDAAATAAPRETHSVGSSGSCTLSPSVSSSPRPTTHVPRSTFFAPAPSPTPTPPTKPHGANRNKTPASGSFFGQKNTSLFGSGFLVENPGKTQTVAPAVNLFATPVPSGTSPANKKSSSPFPGSFQFNRS